MRNYKNEYRRYHSSAAARAERSSRNKARRSMMKAGQVKKRDGKDVHHKDKNPLNNAKRNLSVMRRAANRAMK